jgi:Ca2+-transporting ATPase
MAAGTLAVLDASLPGGFIEGKGNMGYAQTMAFTTGLFSNPWLWAAVGLSLLLQVAVVYVPFLQHAFSTVPLAAADWLVCAAVASSVLWIRELTKLVGVGR